MSESTRNLLQPAPSPTGTPQIPVWLSPYASAIVVLAGGLTMVLPPESVWMKACQVVLFMGSAYGIMSAGGRK